MIRTRFHPVTLTTRLATLAALTSVLVGCQGVAGIQPVSQVRVIDASPDAPAVDIYQNSTVGLYNVGFGTVTSYIPVAPGAYTQAAYTAGTKQQLAATRGTFATGTQYTVLTGNIFANLQMTLLKDQSTPAPLNQVALRFLNQATRAGAVDVYLVPPGLTLSGVAPIAIGLGFGGNTGYINAPSGIYSIVAFATRATPSTAAPEFMGSQVVYPGTSARTIILIDDLPGEGPSAAPALQIITASDYDPPSG